jgi:hypothetical protein
MTAVKARVVVLVLDYHVLAAVQAMDSRILAGLPRVLAEENLLAVPIELCLSLSRYSTTADFAGQIELPTLTECAVSLVGFEASKRNRNLLGPGLV